MGNVGTGTAGTTLIGTGNGSSPTFASIGTSSGLTAHGVVIAEGASPFNATAAATNGQILIGASGLDPAFNNLTSSDGSISFTTGANTLSLQVTGGTSVGKTITGNTGGALSPVAGNWNIFGTSTAAGTTPVNTSGSGNTLTVNVQTAQAIASTNATNIGLAAFNSAQFTVDANGFVSTSGGGVTLTLTGNTGGAISPSAGNINTIGTGSITIAGSGHTLTTQLTGLTNHAVLVGAGTATITNVGPTATSGQVLQSQGSTTDPAFSTATYPSTTTINQILYSNAANTVTGLATANDGVLTTGTTGVPVITALASDGQLIIGSSAGAPTAATLTAGSGITITNGHNSITIASTGSSGAILGQARATSTSQLSNSTTLSLTGTPTTANTAQIISVTYTPTSATSILIFDFSTVLGMQASMATGFFIFASTTLVASYIAGAQTTTLPVSDWPVTFKTYITSGTTSSTTYAVYYAPVNNTAFILQNSSSTAFYGGTAVTTFIVTEVHS